MEKLEEKKDENLIEKTVFAAIKSRIVNKRKKTIIDVVLTHTVTLIFSLLFVIMAFFVYSSLTNNIPSIMGYQVFRILTGSMEPEYPADSYIIIEQVSPGTLKVGDVITFFSNDETIKGKLNTHRIIRINDKEDIRSFVTKGDANTMEDSEPVYDKDIRGKVVFRAKFLDWLGMILRKQQVYLILVILPLLVMMIVQMKNVAIASLELKKNKNLYKNGKYTNTTKIETDNIELQELIEKYGPEIIEMIEKQKKENEIIQTNKNN